MTFSGAVFGFILTYRDRGLPDIVIRRPNFPGLNFFSPKEPGLVVLEELPDHSAASASLENANYHAPPLHLSAIISPLEPMEVSESLAHHAVSALFSVSDESEGSSSPGSSEASPREQEAEIERGRLGQAMDRLRSGLNTTSGFQRF